jgi:hypothetical protein
VLPSSGDLRIPSKGLECKPPLEGDIRMELESDLSKPGFKLIMQLGECYKQRSTIVGMNPEFDLEKCLRCIITKKWQPCTQAHIMRKYFR